MAGLYPSIHAAFDVKYTDDSALVGYVIFRDHLSSEAMESGQILHHGIEPYEPGSFYKRELPCLMTAITQLMPRIGLIYIDANVWLGDDTPGLGYHLYHALDKKMPVIGVSKTKYFGETSLVKKVFRANSANPLYVSSIGIELDIAVAMIKEMHGEFRIPAMLKLADTMSRKG